MDNNGFIFTIDAVLALIPVFIIIAAVTTLGDQGLISTSQEIRTSQDAQDTLETMALYGYGMNKSVIQAMTFALASNHNNDTGIRDAGQIASEFLNKTLPGMKYNLKEVNRLNGVTIAANADLEDAENLAAGVKSYGNYTFQLLVWD